MCIRDSGFIAPNVMDGMGLVDVHAENSRFGSTNTVISIRNHVGNDMLSTNITIDANENGSDSASVQPVINSAYKNVSAYDRITIAVDAAGADSAGLFVTLTFRLP